jgi:hypothetical protein
MKKLLGVLAMGLACAMLAACNPGGTPSQPVDKDKVLEVADFEQFSVVGQHQIEVDGEDVANEWKVKDYNVMRAVSLNQLAAMDSALEAKVEAKGVRGLYVLEGVVLGANDAGYDKTRPEGEEIVTVNGSYTFKVCGDELDDEEVWQRATHYPSAEAHGESLTDNLWITENMTATIDDNGYDHNTDPVAKAAGAYTVVFALYKAPQGPMSLSCGIGLIKTGDRDPYVAPETYPVEKLEVIGGFNDWSDDTALEMTKNENTFTAQLVLEAASEIKIRANGEWKRSFGKQALEGKVVGGNDDNIALGAATWNISITLSSCDDLQVGDEIVAFTIEPEGEVAKNPVESMDVAGDFNSWTPGDDDKLAKDGNTFSGDIALASAGALKVRVNCDWTIALGATALETKVVTGNDGNISLEAGEYTVTVTFAADDMEDIAVGAELVAFTIEAKGAADPKGSQNNPFTVAEALAEIMKLEDGKKSSDRFYVSGVCTEFVKTGSSGDFQFKMADSEDETEAVLLVYYAKPNGNQQPAKGDLVVVEGLFQKFVSGGNVTPEMASGTNLVSVTPKNA